MYYRINVEPTGSYLTVDEKRVALLYNAKPAAPFRALYTELKNEEEAIAYFKLRPLPLTES